MKKVIWEKIFDNKEEPVDISQLNEDEKSFFSFFIGKKEKHYVDFNLWYMHTDFIISPAISKIIQDVPGVEVWSPISPYRAIVGFGKAFVGKDGTVSHLTKSVEMAILGENLNIEPVKEKITDFEKLVNTLKREKQEFAILVLPNGSFEVAHANERNNTLLEEKLELFERTAKLTGGNVIKSWS